jgi:hypothetical protein
MNWSHSGQNRPKTANISTRVIGQVVIVRHYVFLFSFISCTSLAIESPFRRSELTRLLAGAVSANSQNIRT